MSIQRTLSIVKPEAVSDGLTGTVVQTFEKAGLRLVALRILRLSADEAGRFYHVHHERPFFSSLTEYMTSGPIELSTNIMAVGT